MSVDKRIDPFLAYNFQVSLIEASDSKAAPVTTISITNVIDKPVAGFSECSGLEMNLEVEDYQQGGGNDTVLKFPTRVKWSNLILKKGLSKGTELWDWFYGFVEGRGERKDGVITLMNEKHEPQVVWGFVRGMPMKYTGPSMNAQQSDVAIETVEIVHEGLYQLPGAGGLASAVGEAFGALKDFSPHLAAGVSGAAKGLL